jgi:hypothetical protein
MNGNERTIQRINETKNWVFEKINKTDRLTKLTKNRRRRHKSIK